MNASQFATRARVALCARWPELERYNQTELLRILEDTFRSSEQIAEQQGVAIAKNNEATTIPPTLLQVRAYFQELASDVDPMEFWEFYGAKGWMIGKSKMKNWHLAAQRAARTWGQRGSKEHSAATMTEWERSKKEERLRDLKSRIHEITHPGGSAWGVELTVDKRDRVDAMRVQLHALEKELGRV